MKLHHYLATLLVLTALAPSPVMATDALVKSPSFSAVYYLGTDGKRYVFPSEGVYKSWYGDFSGVTTISDAELFSLPIGGNVTYKPGARMVKITTDPKVYAVDRNGTLRWIVGEQVASALYGVDWAKNVHDIPDAFFVNYRVGTHITSTDDFSPLERLTVSNISEDRVLVEPVAIAPGDNALPVQETEGPKILSFDASKSVINKDEKFTLTWDAEAVTCLITTNPDSVTVPFIGKLPEGASEYSEAATYTLVCADKDWLTVKKSLSVSLESSPITFTQEPVVTVSQTASGTYKATFTYATNKPTTSTGFPSGELRGNLHLDTIVRFTDMNGNYTERVINITTGPGAFVLAGEEHLTLAGATSPTAEFKVLNTTGKDIEFGGISVQLVTEGDVHVPESARLKIRQNNYTFFDTELGDWSVDAIFNRIIPLSSDGISGSEPFYVTITGLMKNSGTAYLKITEPLTQAGVTILRRLY